MRAKAFKGLIRVLRDRHSRETVLHDLLAQAKPEERKPLTQLIYGTLRHWFLIQSRLLSVLGKRKLPEEVRILLSMTVYQIDFMDSVPAYAAVHEGVGLLPSRFKGLKPTVNWALREYLRARPDSSVIDLPEWFEQEFLRIYPPHLLEDLKLRLQSIPLVTYLTNEVPLPGSTKVYEKPPIYVLDQADWETRQKHQDCLFCDPASILIPRLFTNHPKTIADFCAAPGNKLRSLHQHYRPESLLGLEKDKHRFEEMQQRLLPLAMNGLVLQNADALEQNGLFDAILLDAPCSAFGTILSQPEFLISKSVEDKSSRVPLQKSLLEKAWACLKPGGELLYSVCTFTKEETEDLFEVLPADAESIPVGVPWRGNWVGGRIGSWLFPEGLGDQMFYLAHLKKICT